MIQKKFVTQITSSTFVTKIKKEYMKKEFNIGKLIREKVAERKMSVPEFTDKIGCNRDNGYKIFRSNDISILRLKKICEILQYNFFNDLSQNIDLIENIEETNETKKEEAIYSLILNDIPKLLTELNREDFIIFHPQNQEFPTPDFGLVNHYNISFTINESLEERVGKSVYNTIKKLQSKTGYEIEECTIKLPIYGDHHLIETGKIINITIDKVYKKEELKELLEFAFTIYDSKKHDGKL